MKFEKPIVLYDVEKEGLEKIIEKKEKCRPILSLGDSIPWKRNTKQIFLFYAEKMANLLPPENRNRLEVEALSLFPTNDEVCGEESLFSPYHFALPFDDKYIVEESESKQDKEEWEKCKESDMPYLDTYYGRIYTNMLKPRAISQDNKTKNIGEELIDIAIELCLYCMKTQVFLDGNKRASVIFANHYLIAHGMGFIVIPEEKVPQFKKLLVEFYEGKPIEVISKFMKKYCWKNFDDIK